MLTQGWRHRLLSYNILFTVLGFSIARRHMRFKIVSGADGRITFMSCAWKRILRGQEYGNSSTIKENKIASNFFNQGVY